MISRFASRLAPPSQARRGALTVEFAVTVPILFVFVWATFEFQRAYMIRHALNEAAYEGARVGICPGATSATVSSTASTILANFKVTGSTITVSPSTITDSTTQVTVTITTPLAANFWFTPIYVKAVNFTTTCTLQHENALFDSQTN